MKILALEPFYGGSHRAFLDGWVARSRHEFTLFTLPDSHWKWRMRHAAVTLAEEIHHSVADGAEWDLIWASDMLNLAELRGLLPPVVARLPTVLYFHENQLTYPVREEQERDRHFAFTNFVSACATEQAWFNSAFHRDEFLSALPPFLRAMPDRQPTSAISEIAARSFVQAPGVDLPPSRQVVPAEGPLRILWAARWEHDKNPAEFLSALEIFADRGGDFRLGVIGETYRKQPPEFAAIRARFADRIQWWGFQADRQAYLMALAWADVFVSTALHEFFGITAVEAIAAGAMPLLPHRLAYPELLADLTDGYFYDGSVGDLVDKLQWLATRDRAADGWQTDISQAQQRVARFGWGCRSAELDVAAEAVTLPS